MRAGNTEYDDVVRLRKHHPAWPLLRAENAALIPSFFDTVFAQQGIRSSSGVELAYRLGDELYALNERLGEQARIVNARPRNVDEHRRAQHNARCALNSPFQLPPIRPRSAARPRTPDLRFGSVDYDLRSLTLPRAGQDKV